MARDPLEGVGPHDPPMRTDLLSGSRGGGNSVAPWLIAGIVLVGAVVGIASFVTFDTVPPSALVGNQVAPDASPVVAAIAALPTPPAAPVSAPVPADFVITAALVGKALSVEQVRAAAGTPKSLCRGEPLSIRNDTPATVTLLETPEDSDATIELAKVKSGALLRFAPNEAGTYFLRDRASGGWLFVYKVNDCGVFGGDRPEGLR